MVLSAITRNRIGFIVLGLTNNFAYVIMLSAAYDLLKQAETASSTTNPATSIPSTGINQDQKYCNAHSTSTILLADTLPSLFIKIIYPFIFVNVPDAYKAIGTALFSASSFLVTGFTTDQILIFMGVCFASLSSGLGESTYLSSTPLYGDASLSGWSMGTGGAGLLGSAAYAVLRMILSIKAIMIIMLIVPIAMLSAYFLIIRELGQSNNNSVTQSANPPATRTNPNLSIISGGNAAEELAQDNPFRSPRQDYGSSGNPSRSPSIVSSVNSNDVDRSYLQGQLINNSGNFGFEEKFHYLPTLAKYFLPLLLVYFAEYFINQGLFELIYYPEVSFLEKAAQYRWFQVSYQLGVMVSRSSLDVVQIHNLWAMSILQALNALLFLAHAAKLIHIPSFWLVIALIIYEGLLGGFTYVNTFYRIKKEVPPGKTEFGISTVTIADTLGIVFAGAAALPVHAALCKLYEK